MREAHVCNFLRLLEDVDREGVSKVEDHRHGHRQHAHDEGGGDGPGNDARPIVRSVGLAAQGVQRAAQALQGLFLMSEGSWPTACGDGENRDDSDQG